MEAELQGVHVRSLLGEPHDNAIIAEHAQASSQVYPFYKRERERLLQKYSAEMVAGSIPRMINQFGEEVRFRMLWSPPVEQFMRKDNYGMEELVCKRVWTLLQGLMLTLRFREQAHGVLSGTE